MFNESDRHYVKFACLVGLGLFGGACGGSEEMDPTASTELPNVFGSDHRVEIDSAGEIASLEEESTVALVPATNLVSQVDGSWAIDYSPGHTGRFTQANINNASQPVCSTESFYNQPSLAGCSGVLVGPNLVATAAHCVCSGPEPTPCSVTSTNISFVFDYKMNGTTEPATFSASQVYTGSVVKARGYVPGVSDWALVYLDQYALNRRVVQTRRNGKVADNESIYAIGFPTSLPMKYAGSGFIKDNSGANYIDMAVDTFQGNSGSAIYGVSTHKVEAILTGGPVPEFTQSGTCFIHKVCSVSTGCPGWSNGPRATGFSGLIPGYSGIYFANVTGIAPNRADLIQPTWDGVLVRASSGSSFASGPASNWTNMRYVGNQGNYFADVTGDGLADAIVVTTVQTTVRRSNGSSFLANEAFTTAPWWGDYGTYFADVDNDHKADAIVLNENGVWVRKSTGTSFGASQRFRSVAWNGTYGTYFADVDNDHKADLLAVDDDGVLVLLSNGSAFTGNASLPSTNWTAGQYLGSYGNYFADVTGDGRADAIVVNGGGITVRRSTGTSFGPNEAWTAGGFVGSEGNFFADVTGDGKADAIITDGISVIVRAANSDGTGFEPVPVLQNFGEVPLIGAFPSSQNGSQPTPP